MTSMTESSRGVAIYADGACSPNPGAGGYGVVLLSEGDRRELSGGFLKTTNNRMELFSVITGVESIKAKPCNVTVYSDSKYVVDNFHSAKGWRVNAWKRDKKHMAQNPDLWKRLLDCCAGHEVKFVWVRGHSENRENERCDELAVEARKKKDLPLDDGYENPKTPIDPDEPTLFDAL